jgi:uncharacterized protein (TIGR02001 family)
VAAGCCGPASAQVAGRIGVQSDYLLRGASITRHRAVGTLDLSYDFPVGVYLNGSTFGALPSGGHLGLVGLIGDIGYARRLSSKLSVDAGVTRTQYIGVGARGYSVGYTELYGGLSGRHLSARLYYSPDYFRPGVQTLYGEVGGDIGLVAGVRLNGHVGTVVYLDRPAALPPARTQYDWMVGLFRQFGPVDLHMAVSGGGPEQYSS